MNIKEKEILKDIRKSKALNTLKYDELLELESLYRKKENNLTNIFNLIMCVYVLGYERGTKQK